MNDYINFNDFRHDVDATLKILGEKYGLNIKSGNISYNDKSFSMKLECNRTDIDVEKENFVENLRYMKMYGCEFTEADYKREFLFKNKPYLLIGFKPGNKYDCIISSPDGSKSYKIPHSEIKFN